MDFKLMLSNPIVWIFLTFIYLLYKRVAKCYSFFSDRGIPGPKPIPFIGNVWGMWKRNLPGHSMKMCKKYGNIYGTFEGLSPNLWINDTKIIRSVLIKDFSHFSNRRNFDVGETKILRKFVSITTNQEWKDIRAAVSPTFTTNKIKRYSEQMKQCSELLCPRLQSLAKNEGKIDLKEQLSAATMDIIAKCAFGLEIENLDEKQNVFMEKARLAFQQPINTSPMILALFLLPETLIKWANILVFKDGFQFFMDFMENLVADRSKSNQKFHDFPEAASESVSAYTKEENGKTVPMWSNEEIKEIVTAQSVLFLLAGFDTTANTLTSSCFILARHPEIQEKLYDIVMSKCDQYGDICHEMLLDIPYLDHFINEVLRMYAPVPLYISYCCPVCPSLLIGILH